jgi:hypothetical protein
MALKLTKLFGNEKGKPPVDVELDMPTTQVKMGQATPGYDHQGKPAEGRGGAREPGGGLMNATCARGADRAPGSSMQWGRSGALARPVGPAMKRPCALRSLPLVGLGECRGAARRH